MQRRGFIAALAGALGAVVGIVKGGSALATEAKAQSLATGGPVKWYWTSSAIGTKDASIISGGYDMFAHEGRRGYYGSLPEIHVGQVNGHVERIWFDDDLVYQCRIAARETHDIGNSLRRFNENIGRASRG